MATIFESFGIRSSERYRFIIDSLVIEGTTEVFTEKDSNKVKNIMLTDVKFLFPDNSSLIKETDQFFIKLDSVSAFWAV